MVRFPKVISKTTIGTDLLRLTVCAILFVHGFNRFKRGEAGGLGELLVEEHVPAGLLLGYLICIAETVGTVLLALQIVAVPICLILSLIYFTGIMMFMRFNGFFVVGPLANGGWEYNALIIASLLATAWIDRQRGFFPLGRRV
jgi:putative oxidoreductase